jgi:poly-gamma-glutamate synthesis protein (capsule biosynthesis protein)
VALIATATTYTPMSVAQAPIERRDGRSRPGAGISVIRTDAAVNVTREEMAILAAIGEHNRLVPASGAGAPAMPERLQLGSQAFRLADALGTTFDANADDQTTIVDSIAAARRQAPVVVFSIHAHETVMGDADWDDPRPAAFLQPLFHRAIDAGAGVVVRHGPHVLNGIEIYHGRPILYGLGSLFFDFGGKRSYTVPGTSIHLDFPDAWFETAVAVARFRKGQLAELRLYPMQIEVSERPTCGLPRLATGADARRILERVRQYSEPFGTDVRIEGDVGVVYGLNDGK